MSHRLPLISALKLASFCALGFLISCGIPQPAEGNDEVYSGLVEGALSQAVVEASKLAFAAEGIPIANDTEWHRPVGGGAITNGYQMYGQVSWANRSVLNGTQDLYIYIQYRDGHEEETVEVRADTVERAKRVFEFVRETAPRIGAYKSGDTLIKK